MDIVFVALIVAFFVLALGYVAACNSGIGAA